MFEMYSLPDLQQQVFRWKQEGRKIVFTNGCFDVLHLGHVTYLQAAAQMGDVLIVAVNSDASVKRLNKGAERPINPENARATVVGALKGVHATIIFDEDTPLNMIKALLPDVLVKGGDYDPEEENQNATTYMVGADVVKANGGEVKTIHLVAGYSTTALLEKYRK